MSATLPAVSDLDRPARPLDSPTGGARFGALADRARELLALRGGEAAPADLASWVFGARQDGPWQPLLERILRADPRFERFELGWRLAGHNRGETPPDKDQELVAVALATTGSDPRRHRIVRIAAQRMRGGTPTGRFDVAVDPRRRLPRYLSRAARLSQEEADEAPPFAQVAEPLREFCGSAPLVAYGVQWVLDFLAAELARADLLGLSNDSIELDDLARRLLPEHRKPSLRAIAEQLGLNHPRPNYPPADADVAGRVTVALLGLTCERGHAEPAIGDRPNRGEPSGRAALVDRRWLAGVPDVTGVYRILDSDGAVLYVGKATRLRRRLAAYLGRAFGLHRQLEGLATRAARVEWEPTPSDIEARLLEARLIRDREPPFNVARHARPRPLLLRAAANDPVPRVHLVREVAADGALYLGPFRSARAARDGLALVRSVYPLLRLRRAVDPPAQRDTVHAAVRLLTGSKAEALAHLRAAMRDGSARADPVERDRARALIRAVLDFEICPSPLLGISPAEPIVVVEPASADRGTRRVHLVRAGHLLGSTDVPAVGGADEANLAAVAAALQARSTATVSPEDVPIVTQWLGELGPDHAIVSLERLGRGRLGGSVPV